MADGESHAADFQPQDRVRALRAELADRASRPANASLGLSGQHYVDPGYFEHEKQTVLAEAWHCVGRTDELREHGDYLTVQILDEPVIVVRDKSRIRALSNVCRHRGMPLVQGQGRAKLFVCPYHAWSYRPDGQLQRAGGMENAAFDPAQCKLPSFACEERFGFVYVSLAEEPSDIDAGMAELAETLAPYEAETYRHLHTASEIWRCNWKALVENFMEGYHLSVVHPQTLHGYTPTRLSVKGPSGAGFTSYFAKYPENIPSRGQGSEKLRDDQRHQSFLCAHFPLQVASIAPSLFVSLSLLPRSVDQVEVRWTMSVFGEDLSDETIRSRIDLWTEVNREDREKLELMQAALSSRHATGGPLAQPDYEGTVRDFLDWLAQADQLYP